MNVTFCKTFFQMDHNKRLKPSSNRFCLQKTARGSHLDSGDQYKLVWFCASEFFFFYLIVVFSSTVNWVCTFIKVIIWLHWFDFCNILYCMSVTAVFQSWSYCWGSVPNSNDNNHNKTEKSHGHTPWKWISSLFWNFWFHKRRSQNRKDESVNKPLGTFSHFDQKRRVVVPFVRHVFQIQNDPRGKPSLLVLNSSSVLLVINQQNSGLLVRKKTRVDPPLEEQGSRCLSAAWFRIVLLEPVTKLTTKK